MLAVTTQVYSLPPYVLELIYVAIFMLGMTAAILLGRWTTKRLLTFMFVIATLMAVAKAAAAIANYFPLSTLACIVSV